MSSLPPPRLELEEYTIEIVAEALYLHRFYTHPGSLPWAAFKKKKPDIAKIYRENAGVALQAIAKMP